MTRADGQPSVARTIADAADADPFAVSRRPGWPRLRPSVLATIFLGGCVGGLVRYLVTEHWSSTSGSFPWPTFTVNIAGAFVLAVLIVVVSDVLGPSTYLRPLVGTGFCGALTTFSSIVVATDQLIAHGHAGVAATYLVASIVAGLAAGALGLVLGRSFAARRRQVRDGGH